MALGLQKRKKKWPWGGKLEGTLICKKCWYNDNKKKTREKYKKNLIVEFKSCLEHRPLLHWAQLSLVVHPAHTAVFLERVVLLEADGPDAADLRALYVDRL